MKNFYKIFMSPDGLKPCGVILNENTAIPMNEANTDYQAYLKWVAEGNTPLPADVVTDFVKELP